MMMNKSFAALAAACLFLLTASKPANAAAASLRQDVDSHERGTVPVPAEASSIVGAIADSAAPLLLEEPREAALAATREGEPRPALDGSTASSTSNAGAHPGLRGLANPADCPPTKPKSKPTHPKPTKTSPAMGKGKGQPSPSKTKNSKAKNSKSSKTMDYGKGKGKGQVKSKGSKGGRPKKSKKSKGGKGGKGGCTGGPGCSKSKSEHPGKGKGQVKSAKKSAKGPKSSKGGCTHCPPTKPSPPKPAPTKPTPAKPTPKCTGSPGTTTAPTANIEMPPDDTCERQCMQWVYQNCVVLDELGEVMEDHCIVPFPFDDDLFGRSLVADGSDVMPAKAVPSTVQEKIDYHRRMAHVYQQVLSLID